MANEDKKDFNAMRMTVRICQRLKSLQIGKVLRNMVETGCILHRRLTTTK